MSHCIDPAPNAAGAQVGTIAPGGMASAALPMSYSAEKTATPPAGAPLLLLQVAVKHQGGVFYYKDTVALQVLLSERVGP